MDVCSYVGGAVPLWQVYTCASLSLNQKTRRHQMDAFFSFLFNTREGVAVLFVAGIVIFALVAFVLEKRTSKIYVDRGPKKDGEDDGWGLFG